MFNTHRLASLAVGGASLVIAGVAATLSFEAAHVFAPGQAALALAVGAVAAEVPKSFWLVGATVAWGSGRRAASLAIVIMGICLHVYSLMSAVGLAAAGRNVALSASVGAQDTHARALKALDEAESRVKSVGSARPVATVSAELEVAESRIARDVWTRTSACTDVTKPASAAVCSPVIALRAEKKQALEAEQARRDVAEARQRVDQLPRPLQADPQAAALAAYLPLSEEWVGKLLPLAPSLLVEVVPAIGLLLASILWTGGEPPMPREVEARGSAEGASSGRDDPEAQALDRVIGWVLNTNGELVASQRQLAAQLGVPVSTFNDWVRAWAERGLIEAERRGNATAFRLRRAA